MKEGATSDLEGSFISNSQTKDKTMTTFNGFQTIQQESVYNTITNKVITLLSEKCIEFLSASSNNPAPLPVSSRDNFAVKMIKLDRVLKKLEEERSPPSTSFNISRELAPLTKFLINFISASWSTAKITPYSLPKESVNLTFPTTSVPVGPLPHIGAHPVDESKRLSSRMLNQSSQPSYPLEEI